MGYLDFMFQGFWHFIGSLMLIGLILNFMSSVWSNFCSIFKRREGDCNNYKEID